MKNKNQITQGRKQILEYLAQKGDWVYVAYVFKDVKPDGISTSAGVLKALKEMEYVEMDDVGTPARPTYKCRLKQDPGTLHALFAMFVNIENEHSEKFLQTLYVQNVLNISGFEVYQTIMNIIGASMATVLFALNIFYPNLESPDQIHAALMAGVSDGSAGEQFSQKRQEVTVLMRATMDNLEQLLPILSDLPNLYEEAISPDIRSDS